VISTALGGSAAAATHETSNNKTAVTGRIMFSLVVLSIRVSGQFPGHAPAHHTTYLRPGRMPICDQDRIENTAPHRTNANTN
jgi:hypothetical protein